VYAARTKRGSRPDLSFCAYPMPAASLDRLFRQGAVILIPAARLSPPATSALSQVIPSSSALSYEAVGAEVPDAEH
jgi:hypothetical protein